MRLMLLALAFAACAPLYAQNENGPAVGAPARVSAFLGTIRAALDGGSTQ